MGVQRALVWMEQTEEKGGLGGVQNDEEGTDSGPDRPHQGGVLILKMMRAANMIEAEGATRLNLCFEEKPHKLPGQCFSLALAGSRTAE